ncbi:parathyroid hormone/parathyroid hormone-related peptide receptor-like [Varroa jacobsoni]|uniref:parathyroid hormone/parathyroid hormone-related peptide receptor-like n=1 Tax=Varroa jacobsoni TaxID=62625 RepID=UPI000BF921F8|nr:parathyroid hormone/parathyroid hormone-related peptide receptor-like [Varroa jacobsoni]
METDEDMMKRFLAEAKRNCLSIANNGNDSSNEINGVFNEVTSFDRCPREWDGFLCWPSSPASQSVQLRCPDMLYAFDTSQFASRTCGDNGTWTLVKITPIGPLFTNYTMCTLATQDHINTIEAFQPHIRMIKFLARIGYGVSLVSLICALIILISIKRLRCPRNCLHMNLFTSFILRAAIFLLKDRMFISGVGLYGTFDDNQKSICCKLFLAMFHYTLMANYCWILMEGLYLHSLVFHSLGNDPSSISKYTIMGWGLPVLFIAPWSLARALWENKLCWTTNKIGWHEWIIRGPITLSIVVNFILFVNITRVLFVKMFASQAPVAKRYKYRKWFKSTLVLVPLFGSHYSLLLVASIAADLLSPQVEVYWMYIDQTFSSFQVNFLIFIYIFF